MENCKAQKEGDDQEEFIYNKKLKRHVSVPPRTNENIKTTIPMTDSSMTDSPMTDSPMTDSPMTDSSMTESSMTESPMTESPMTESPMPESPMPESSVMAEAEIANTSGADIWRPWPDTSTNDLNHTIVFLQQTSNCNIIISSNTGRCQTISHHGFEPPHVQDCETQHSSQAQGLIKTITPSKNIQETEPSNCIEPVNLIKTSQPDSTLPAPGPESQTKNISSKTRHKTKKPGSNPQRKKKIIPVPQGCNLTEAEIVDTEDFDNKTAHLNDDVKETLKRVRRMGKNRKSASDSRKRKNNNLWKLRDDHKKLSQKNIRTEGVRQMVFQNKDDLARHVRLLQAELKRLKQIIRAQRDGVYQKRT